MPPGMTYWPAASIVWSAVCAPRCDGWVRPTILPASIQTSETKVSEAVTTVPSLMSVRMSVLDQGAISVGAAIAEELPGPADLLDHVEIERGDQELVLILARRRHELAARIDEVRVAVELADVPRPLGADPVDRADEVAVGDRVRRLLDLPQMLRQPGDRRRRVVDDLGAGQSERPRALGEVAVVADVCADRRVPGLEHRIAQVARPEEELLPEPGDLRNMRLAILAEIAAVGVEERRGVLVHAGLLALVDRDHHRHLVLPRDRHQLLHRRAGHRLGGVVPPPILARAEVRAIEDLLQTQDLDTLLAGVVDHRQVFLEHRRLDIGDAARFIVDRIGGLDQAADDITGHVDIPSTV